MDYDKLIERLSRYSEPVIAYKLDGDFAAAVTEAAAELRGKCAGCSVPATTAEMIRDLNDAPKLRAENKQLRADLARVTAERDAAVKKYEAEKEDFLDYALSGTKNAAPFCTNRHPDCVDKRGWCIPVKCHGFSRDKED